ncbi:MAG: protein phosphatase CheZ [Spongiibacteraceae bacterium]
MLGAESFEGQDELLDELKERARALVEQLESGNFAGAAGVIQSINEARDRSIYREVGKLTRGLHDAIRNFEIETGAAGLDHDRMSKMANAQERLDYVINLTQKSADKTMDMVEEGIPVAEKLGAGASALRADWQRLIRRDMKPDEFRELYHRIDSFLGEATHESSELSAKFNSILLAQDYQDLSGQVIKKVITLVQEVEARLVELMRVAGQVEQLTGIFRPDAEAVVPKGADIVAEGPAINAHKRADVVSGQDDVDDLLSSLGF